MVVLQHDLNDQYKITLPKQIVVAKGWKKGDLLQVVINSRGELILKLKHEISDQESHQAAEEKPILA